MINRLLRFVLDREPVQAAAGLAGVITAGFGLLESFEILSLTPVQVGAIGLFVTAVAGWLARKRAWSPEHHTGALVEAHNAYSQPARQPGGDEA